MHRNHHTTQLLGIQQQNKQAIHQQNKRRVRFAASFDHSCNNERRKPAVSRKKQLVNNNSFSDIASGTPTVVVSHGRNLRSSLQRLEQQQDEIFEL